jgi:hypothetical protein
VVNVEGDPALSLQGHEDYENIAIFVDRTADTGNCISVAGQGNLFVDGNIYAISCDIGMSGGSDAVFDLNGTIVANTIDFGGGAEYNVHWSEEFAPKIGLPAIIE